MHFLVSSLKKFSTLSIALISVIQLGSCDNNKTAGPKTGTITLSQNDDQLFKKYNLDKIKLPAGFKISIYAEVDKARSMCVSPGGTLFVGTRGGDRVLAITDENHDGKADKAYVVASGLKTPNGV